MHEDWDDNLFLTLNYDNGFEEHARNAPVVVEREMTMARQAMVPLEGKAIVADWDYRADQLIVYTLVQGDERIVVEFAPVGRSTADEPEQQRFAFPATADYVQMAVDKQKEDAAKSHRTEAPAA